MDPSSGANNDVAIEISKLNNGNQNGANGTNDETHQPKESTNSSFYSRNMQLVELSLEHVTYAPATRSAAATGGARTCCTKTKVKNRRITILSDVTSKISPYQLSAWMGPSGSGKTSLVSVAAGLLSDPTNDLVNDSCIKINGEMGSLPKRLVGVVWQDDLLLSNLTVKETVRFAARLKTPQQKSDHEVEMLVEDTLSRLGLTHIQDSLIGVPGGSGKSRGISGGERKRVAVAVELVARPSILILDEPTSGLDATTAQQLMVTLKDLASLGHAIAVVIHQPRTSIFDMFDNLLLLSRGKVVYEGEPVGARHFLESCPGVGELPPETGKADWIMDVINEDENREGGGVLPSLWEEFSLKQQQPPHSLLDGSTSSGNQLKHRHSATIKSSQAKSRRLSTLQELENEPKFQTSFWTQLKLLTTRVSRQQRGDRLTRVAILLTSCWIAFTGLAWGHIPDTEAYIFNRASLLFFIIIAQSNSVVVSSMVTFTSERRLLSRERAKKMYGVLPYFIAKTLSDMVNSVVLPTFYGIVVYWICNLRPTASSFFTFVLTLYLTISAAQSTGLFLSVAIPNMAVALMLAPFLTLCFMILGGFYIPYDSIHPALAWASWFSFARYGFSAFILNEFDGRDIPCDSDSIGECPVAGSSVVADYDIEGIWTSVWVNVGILIAIQVFLQGSTYILLLRSK
mmetsp:Transcript_36097/g.66159  ORF Transcript_36097/g.66159 Transcript_36097/m.66159 type:complete len:684 (-) Transcript_36097:150-2201(-)